MPLPITFHYVHAINVHGLLYYIYIKIDTCKQSTKLYAKSMYINTHQTSSSP